MAPILFFCSSSCSSQQKIADTKDESTMMRESVWVDDRNITDCQQCKKPFSVARRK